MKTIFALLLLIASAQAQLLVVGKPLAAIPPDVDALSSTTTCRTNSVTSQTCAVGVTSGDLVVFGLWIGTPNSPSVSGSAVCNGTWTLSAASGTVAFWVWTTATGTGTCTATLSNGTSGTLGLRGLSIKNTSGLDAVSAWAAGPFKGAGTCPSTNNYTYTAVTTTAANDLVFTLAIDSDSSSSTMTLCDGTWAADFAGGGQPTVGIQHKSVAGIGSVTPGSTVFSAGSTQQRITLSAKP